MQLLSDSVVLFVFFCSFCSTVPVQTGRASLFLISLHNNVSPDLDQGDRWCQTCFVSPCATAGHINTNAYTNFQLWHMNSASASSVFVFQEK